MDKPLYVYSLPFKSTGSLTSGVQQVNETWNVSILFFMQDQSDSAVDQNDESVMQAEIEILTICEQAASKMLHYMNENTLSDDLSDAADQLNINSFSKDPAIKDTPNILTGIVLTMNITVPDSFNYCC